jgi:hypothetical protein
MQTISISEIQRNLHKLDSFDIIEVVDKKRNQIKGYFLDKKYHGYVEEIIQAQEDKKNDTLFDKVRGIIPTTIDPVAWQQALREENESNPYEEMKK